MYQGADLQGQVPQIPGQQISVAAGPGALTGITAAEIMGEADFEPQESPFRQKLAGIQRLGQVFALGQ
jgi:hypothetical protein